MKRKRLWPLCLLLCLTLAAVSVASCDKENSDNIEFVKNAPKQNWVEDHCFGWARYNPVPHVDTGCVFGHFDYPGWINDYFCCAIIISDDCIDIDPPIGPQPPQSSSPIYMKDNERMNPYFRQYLDSCVAHQQITLTSDCPIKSPAVTAYTGLTILPAGTYSVGKEGDYYTLGTCPIK